MRLLVTLIITSILLQGLCWGLQNTSYEAYLPWCRAVFGLASGYMLAVYFQRKAPKYSIQHPQKKIYFGLLCFLLAMASILLASEITFAHITFPYFAALNIYNFAYAEWKNDVLLIPALRKLISFFSSRSYAIYMVHMPLVTLSSGLIGNLSGNIPLKITAIAITIVFSDLVYRFIEVPGYALRKQFV